MNEIPKPTTEDMERDAMYDLHCVVLPDWQVVVKQRDAWIRRAALAEKRLAVAIEVFRSEKKVHNEIRQRDFSERESYKRLMRVIFDVHSQHGDDLCWMDVDKIFIAAGLPVPDRKVGDKEAMLQNCKRYIETMCQGGDWKSYKELENIISEWLNCFGHLSHDADEAAKMILEGRKELEEEITKLKTLLEECG